VIPAAARRTADPSTGRKRLATTWHSAIRALRARGAGGERAEQPGALPG
jgi:hypothetical protein